MASCDLDMASAIETELDGLAMLLNGWDQEGAPVIRPELIQAGKVFVRCLPLDLSDRPRVVPMTAGQFQLEWHRGKKSLELEFENPQTIHFLRWDPDNQIEDEGFVSTSDLPSAVNLIRWFMSETTSA